jgi:hypothetical protein
MNNNVKEKTRNKIYFIPFLILIIMIGMPKNYCQKYAPVVSSGMISTWKIPIFAMEDVDIYSIYTTETEDGYFELWDELYYLEYHGKIRPDEENALLYWIAPDSTEEKLIMNLNLEIGDEFEFINDDLYGTPFTAKVDAIYEEYGLKHIQFDHSLQAPFACYYGKLTFIEGVGPNCTFGPVMPYYFLCKHNNQELFYALEVASCIKNCKFNVPGGIDDFNTASAINIYPNPAMNEVTISANTNGCITNLYVMNFLGKTMYEYSFESNPIKLDISDWHQGIYFIKCITNNGETIQKLIINK